MKPFHKFVILLFFVSLVIGVLFSIADKEFSDETKPARIPTYDETVPTSFSVQTTSKVLDPAEANILKKPRLNIVRIADTIVESACPTRHPSCRARAMFKWTQSSIEHIEVLPTTDFIPSPEETILRRRGTDLSRNILLASLLEAEGFDTTIGHTPYSTFVRTRILGEELNLDMACGSCPYGQHRYDGPNEGVTWI